MHAVLFALAASLSTFLGGLFVVAFKHKLHHIMAFTAGVLLGVVSFDIFPEIISEVAAKHYNPTTPMIALAVGFLIFHIVEKSVLIHHANEGEYAKHKHPQVGVFSALALTTHSLMDGIGIGLGFHISTSVGLLIALAVIAHDFTDGMNTITLMLSHNNSVSKAKAFLFLDALAPIVGAVLTLFFTVSSHFLILYLGFFAGFLLYIGASDILPEAHSQKSSFWLIGLTTAGTALMFFVARFI